MAIWLMQERPLALWLLGAVLAIPVLLFALSYALFALAIVVGMRERRLAWPFEPATPSGRPAEFDPASPFAPSRSLGDDPAATPNPYAVRTNGEAARLGFTPLGTFRDVRGGIYRLRYDFWLAPGGDILALVASGTMARLAYDVTRLHTPLANDTLLITLDNQRGSTLDLSGRSLEALRAGASFADLLAEHRIRINASGQPTAPYPAAPAAALAVFRRFRDDRVAALADRGLITFLDPDRNAHRLTPLGSWTYNRQLRAQMREQHRHPA